MMYDVELPGHLALFIQCPLCGSCPEPDRAYTVADPGKWQRLLASGDMTAVASYLLADLQIFVHGTWRDRPCPAKPLPGPALHKLDGSEAMERAQELSDLLKRD
ncbi:hypothetical protein [Streptomyces sp. NPDC008092]|uniref:hypothetical protein n=1 Tax=Streptomyces sp. NPDC008092 TaxID=3364808 RepID=UPI0036E20049